MVDEVDEMIPTRWTLIRRLKDWEDQASWQEFFDTYWRLIYGVAIKAGLSHVEAEEVVQETVVSVTKNIARFKADPSFGSFKGWLFKLTHSRIVDQVRKRPRWAAAPAEHVASRPWSDDSRGTATEERIADPAPDALEQVWEAEWRENVQAAALARLKRRVSARQFQIFYLHVIKQLPARKVTEALHVSLGQVYLAKHRLVGVFRRIVKELEATAVCF